MYQAGVQPYHKNTSSGISPSHAEADCAPSAALLSGTETAAVSPESATALLCKMQVKGHTRKVTEPRCEKQLDPSNNSQVLLAINQLPLSHYPTVSVGCAFVHDEVSSAPRP
jgi:hypothetical protein